MFIIPILNEDMLIGTMLKVIAIVLTILGASIAYPTGAPEEICDSMIPGHGVDPQSSRFEYKATPSEEVVKSSQTVKIEIRGPRSFKGFLIEMRDGDNAVGKFIIQDNDANAKTLNCHSGIAVRNSLELMHFVLQFQLHFLPKISYL